MNNEIRLCTIRGSMKRSYLSLLALFAGCISLDFFHVLQQFVAYLMQGRQLKSYREQASDLPNNLSILQQTPNFFAVLISQFQLFLRELLSYSIKSKIATNKQTQNLLSTLKGGHGTRRNTYLKSESH